MPCARSETEGKPGGGVEGVASDYSTSSCAILEGSKPSNSINRLSDLWNVIF